MKIRCSSYIICQKYWNIDADEKTACIPRLFQKDKKTNWDKSYYHFGYYRDY